MTCSWSPFTLCLKATLESKLQKLIENNAAGCLNEEFLLKFFSLVDNYTGNSEKFMKFFQITWPW